jgi:hypothetical protein
LIFSLRHADISYADAFAALPLFRFSLIRLFRSLPPLCRCRLSPFRFHLFSIFSPIFASMTRAERRLFRHAAFDFAIALAAAAIFDALFICCRR